MYQLLDYKLSEIISFTHEFTEIYDWVGNTALHISGVWLKILNFEQNLDWCIIRMKYKDHEELTYYLQKHSRKTGDFLSKLSFGVCHL